MTWTNTPTEAVAFPAENHNLRVVELVPGWWWWGVIVGDRQVTCAARVDLAGSKTAAKRKAATAYKKIAG